MVRKLVVVRHGERVDMTFSNDWIKSCIDETGQYTKHNLNMPDILPERDYPPHFVTDSPLTEIGNFQATLVGKGLKDAAVFEGGYDVFASPALRSIQTAVSILSGLGDTESDIKVDPGLFEWTGWYSAGVPNWMSLDNLRSNGIKVNTTYESFLKSEDLYQDETVEHYYQRSFNIIKHLLNTTDKDILIVAHGSSLDTLTRQLVGVPPKTTLADMMSALRGVPFCGIAIAEQGDGESDKFKGWKLTSSLSSKLSIRHSSNSDFCAVKAFEPRPQQ